MSQLQPATGPLRVVSTNPCYFTGGSGRAIYLTGSYPGLEQRDARAVQRIDPPDFTAVLTVLQEHNHNFTRIRAQDSATACGGTPTVDPDQLTRSALERLRAQALAAGERGIYVSVVLAGWCTSGDEHDGLMIRGHISVHGALARRQFPERVARRIKL